MIWKKFLGEKYPDFSELTKSMQRFYREHDIKKRGSLPVICNQKIIFVRENNYKKCLRCNEPFVDMENNSDACKYHPQDYTFENPYVREEVTKIFSFLIIFYFFFYFFFFHRCTGNVVTVMRKKTKDVNLQNIH